jgi:riboflavin kinase/FMN adenylyltransferase
MFDGIHIGHRAIIQTMRQLSSHTTILTFSHHPSSYLHPDRPCPPLLTPLETKLAILEKLHIDVVIALPFDHIVAQTPFDSFLDQFPIQHLVLGSGAVLGCRREGRESNVLQLAEQRGWQAHYVQLVSQGPLGPSPTSSTFIRRMVEQGDLDQASITLGRPHGFFFPASSSPLLPPDGLYRATIDRQEVVLSIKERQIVYPTNSPPQYLEFIERLCL